MQFTGVLLAESLRAGASIGRAKLAVTRIWAADAGDPAVGQPEKWTFIEFQVSDHEVNLLVEELRSALAHGPWYCDLRSEDEAVVVFAARAFRYPRNDRAARSNAEAYARSVGVPESQIDWPA